MPLEPIFFNGQWSKEDSIKISPFDRGYLFGDGIYEVIPVYNSQAFRLQEHLNRFEKNLHSVNIPIVYSAQKLEEIIKKTIDQQPLGNYYVYLQITRGVQKPRDFNPTPNTEPQILVYLEKLKPLDQTVIQNGLQIRIAEDPRWQLCHIKSLNLLGSVLMRQKAKAENLDDILYMRNNFLSEATAGNFFAVIDDTVVTPPASNDILAGVTRSFCLELLKECPWKVKENKIELSLLPKITCAWLCSSTKELQPIRRIFYKDQQFKINHKHETFLWLHRAFNENRTKVMNQ